MPGIKDIAGEKYDTVSFGAVTANTTTNYVAIWTAKHNVYITKVEVVFTDAITGANTNTFHLNLDDDDQSTELGTIDFISGTDAVAGDLNELYAPTAPGKSRDSGTSISLENEDIGSGINMPEGNMIVTYVSR